MEEKRGHLPRRERDMLIHVGRGGEAYHFGGPPLSARGLTGLSHLTPRGCKWGNRYLSPEMGEGGLSLICLEAMQKLLDSFLSEREKKKRERRENALLQIKERNEGLLCSDLAQKGVKGGGK